MTDDIETGIMFLESTYGDYGPVRAVLDELNRLRDENTAQTEALAAVRKIQPRMRSRFSLITAELRNQDLGWNDAIEMMRRALDFDPMAAAEQEDEALRQMKALGVKTVIDESTARALGVGDSEKGQADA